MKYKLHWLPLATLAALLGWSSPSWGQEAKTAYGMIDAEGGGGKGIYTFDFSADTLTNIKIAHPLVVDHVMGATLVGDIYYYIDYEQNTKGHKSHGFYSYDMETNAVRKIGDYKDQQQGPAASHFTWDAQTQTLYALNSVQSGDGLVKIDLSNGNLIPVSTFKFDRITEYSKQWDKSHQNMLVSIACNYDGDMYGVSYSGALYKVNPISGDCSMIGELGYNPDRAYMYDQNCLFFDNETGKLFFRFFTFYGNKYEFGEIDLKTGLLHHIATLPYETNESGYYSKTPALDGIVVPYIPAEASAPQKVQNLKLTRGEQGALTATLEWDNPTKTYGRGGTLENLDAIIIYRDGVEVHRIDNPTIGGHERWTDNLTERGYHTYKFVPVNDMGNGDRCTISSYIGVGDPKSVDNLKVEAQGSNAVITWTAPTEGLLSSWINTADLTYDVWRMPDNVKLAEKTKNTSFTDTTLKEMGKYHYNVIAYTGGFQSDSVSTDDIVCGPAYQAPDTLLTDNRNFQLWTNIDADGSETSWVWEDGYFGRFGGATDSYSVEQVAPQNWLISPRIRMEKNKHYKVTFEAKTGSSKITEQLAIGFGQGAEIAHQDSVYQFAIPTDKAQTLRINLPVVKTTGDYNFSFVHRTPYQNYNIAVKNVVFAEDHEGYITGRVTCNGDAVPQAVVRTEDGAFTSTTDENGKYTLSYLPEGNYRLIVETLGYRDGSSTTSVKELETTKQDFNIETLPEYTLRGKVTDVAGDPVADATIKLSGYNDYEVTTKQDGTYTIRGIYEHTAYTVSASKNKLLTASETIDIDADKTLDITLQDNIKPAKSVSVKEIEDGNKAEVTWSAPANDPRIDRIDDGVMTTATGFTQGSTNNTTFGIIRREAATVYGAQFYLTSQPTIHHYSVALRVLGLKDNGDPDENNVLFQKSYVEVEDDQWNEYTLPTPVDAPNGYYLCIATSSWLGIGIDGGGDTAKYPFEANTNCFSSDYTTGEYYYLDNQESPDLHRNFMMRAVAAPFTVDEDHTAKAGRFIAQRPETDEQPQPALFNYKEEGKAQGAEPSTPMKTVQSRVRYNVYRLTTANAADETAWTELANNLQERTYTDTDWKSLPQGTYHYAVKTLYTGDKVSEATLSDSIGNKMLTSIAFNLNTNTTSNEACGASIVMADNQGTHTYSLTADEDGVAMADSVWKTSYDVHIALDGFLPVDTTIVVDKENGYSFDIKLTENQVQPYRLIIEDGSYGAQKLFIWNYPEYFEDGFEDHEDFTINSPGRIGWQYFDGDEGRTGAFSFSQDGSLPWPGAFEPMAFIVMNANNVPDGLGGTMGEDYARLAARSGEKSLQSWPASGMDEDDWLITPRLHFQEPISFRFYALNFSINAPEEIEVLYTTSQIPDVEEFTRIDSCTINSQYGNWVLKQYDNIPAEANYIAIRRVTPADETGYTPQILNIDDVAFGTNLPAPSYYIAKKSASRMPSVEGAYEVYLDGELVTRTNDTEYYFNGLSAGKHTAGVIASYTSGKTAMSTIDFEVDATGVSTVTSGEDDSEAEFYDIRGQRVSNQNLPKGVYIVKKGNHTYKTIKR